MPAESIPMTKKDAFERWIVNAHTRTAAISIRVTKVNEALRRIVQEGRLRGQSEKRLANAIEDLEDLVDNLHVILLGPDVSQEERDVDR